MTHWTTHLTWFFDEKTAGKIFLRGTGGEAVIDADFGVLQTSVRHAVINATRQSFPPLPYVSLSSPSPHCRPWSRSAFMRLNLIMRGGPSWCVSPLIEAEKGDHPSGGGTTVGVIPAVKAEDGRQGLMKRLRGSLPCQDPTCYRALC